MTHTMSQDTRFVAARQTACDKNAWQWPGSIGFVMRAMQDIAANEDADPRARIEAETLIKKLYEAQKRPPLSEQ